MGCRALTLTWVLLALAGCDGPVAIDAGPPPVDAGPGTDAGPPPFWPSTLPSAAELGPRRGRSIARTTLHLHSPLSHDACDGTGWTDGALQQPECLAHLRAAMCALHLDAAMLTDHSPHVNEVDFMQALWIEGDDEPVMDGGELVANRMACPDGHRVLITVGSENALMPVGLRHHPGDSTDPEAIGAIYDGTDAAAIAAMRAAGALVWQAHTEGRSVDELRASGVDGLELYNLHANLAPDIREELLGLEPLSFVDDLLLFTRPALRLPPDLAILSFFEPNQVSLDRWDTLLAEGVRVAASGGCDAHENTFPMELGDGERADSYRRMMFWIENHLLVDDASREGVLDALDAGRFYVTTEVFGSPVGFDFTADGTIEMGEDAPVGATLRVTAPRLPDGWPQEPAPVLTVRLLRAEADGAVEVASGPGDLEHVATQPGAYRVEVRMLPEHARPALGNRADVLVREVTWVYSNPIFVVE
ncbi:MAG: hypothetical protein H6719_21100 [Sandaracinaceae bacterium]|nr:hypothetical protein [Sandaracinaceae bacterium]